MKLKSLILAFAFIASPAAWGKTGEIISFFNSSLGEYDYGTVQSISQEGDLVFRVRQIHDGSYITFSNYHAHISQVGVAVPEKDGFRPGQKVCHQGEKGDLDAVFSNGTGKIVIGDFFGARFFIFERWYIVELSKIETCG